jgi:hypothetical protein
MRLYYLDAPLSSDEIRELEELMHWHVEQVRVPFLLPEGRGAELDKDVPVAPLKAAGILIEYGQRCAFLQISGAKVYWTAQFVEAIGRLTGRLPYMVQTERSRAAIGKEGGLRVLDMDGGMS